jgi:hypothetical protein
VQVAVITQLFQHEIRDVTARDYQLCRFILSGKTMPVLAGVFAIDKGTGTYDGPVQVTLSDVVFLIR